MGDCEPHKTLLVENRADGNMTLKCSPSVTLATAQRLHSHLQLEAGIRGSSEVASFATLKSVLHCCSGSFFQPGQRPKQNKGITAGQSLLRTQRSIFRRGPACVWGSRGWSTTALLFRHVPSLHSKPLLQL